MKVKKSNRISFLEFANALLFQLCGEYRSWSHCKSYVLKSSGGLFVVVDVPNLTYWDIIGHKEGYTVEVQIKTEQGVNLPNRLFAEQGDLEQVKARFAVHILGLLYQ